MVLIIHASFPFQGHALQTLRILQIFSAPAVLIFFFCSGYCLPARASKDINIRYLIPIFQLFIAFIFWILLTSFAAYCICKFNSICPWFSSFNIFRFIDLAGIPGSPIAFQLYFLFALAIIRLFDYIFYQSIFLGRFTFPGIHSLLGIAALVFVGYPTQWHGQSWSNFAIYLFAFGIGRLAALSSFPRHKLSSVGSNINVFRRLKTLALVLLPLVSIFIFSKTDPSHVGLILLPFYLMSVFLGCRSYVKHSSILFELLAPIGLMSGGIFLLHAPFLSSILFKLCQAFIPVDNLFSPVLFVLLLLLASIGALAALRLLLPNPIQKYLLLSDDLHAHIKSK